MAKTKSKAKSNAERQKDYRARRDADPTSRRHEYLQKERAAWNTKKAQKKWKPMEELSERDKRKRRRYNNNAQRRYRERQACLRNRPIETPTSGTPLIASASRYRHHSIIST